MNKIRTGLRAALLAAAVCEALFIMTGCTAADRTGGAEAARSEETVSDGYGAVSVAMDSLPAMMADMARLFI